MDPLARALRAGAAPEQVQAATPPEQYPATYALVRGVGAARPVRRVDPGA